LSTYLLTDREGDVVTVHMNRPESRNALTDPEQMQEFTDLCGDLRRDLTVNAMILTGAGKAFCAGGNIKDMRDRAGPRRVAPGVGRGDCAETEQGYDAPGGTPCV
jgi:enoyl-CoA hydratase/carnithine racemase